MAIGTPVQVRLQNEELHALDEFRRQHANPPSRAAAGRELIRRALIEPAFLEKIVGELAGAS
jgi:hypothetical protein